MKGEKNNVPEKEHWKLSAPTCVSACEYVCCVCVFSVCVILFWPNHLVYSLSQEDEGKHLHEIHMVSVLYKLFVEDSYVSRKLR